MVKRYICNSYQAERFGYKPSKHESVSWPTRAYINFVIYVTCFVLLIVGFFVILMRLSGLIKPGEFVLSKMCRFILYIMGFKTKVTGTLHKSRPLLVLANHYSWIDTLLVDSMIFCAPIYKDNLKNHVFFSWVLKFVNGMSIDPAKRSQVLSQCQSVHRSLQRGQNILIYPEGCTSRGGLTSRFLSSLLASVTTPINGKMIKIQPMSMLYKSVRHINCNRFMRNQISWQSSRSFYEHCQTIMRHQSVQVITVILPAVTMQNYQDRYQMTKKLQYQIQLKLNRSASMKFTNYKPATRWAQKPNSEYSQKR